MQWPPGGNYHHYLANHACPSNFPNELPSKEKKPGIEENYTFVQHVESAIGILFLNT